MRDLDFFPQEINITNIDTFIIRNSISNAIEKNLKNFNGSLIDIGCGKMPYKEYIINNSDVSKYVGLDIEGALQYDNTIKPEFLWDGVEMPFNGESFETAFGTEVLEHCPEPEIVLKETFRVLKPGGIFFFTVPFIWNLHEVPHDEYRYTPYSLERHLRNSGFSNIDIHATGGWHLSLAQMLGLWFRRSSIYNLPKLKRKILSRLVLYTMRKLIKFAKYDNIKFKEGQMITGLYGTAEKH